MLKHAFQGMNEVFRMHGFPEKDLEIAREGLIEVFEQAGLA